MVDPLFLEIQKKRWNKNEKNSNKRPFSCNISSSFFLFLKPFPLSHLAMTDAQLKRLTIENQGLQDEVEYCKSLQKTSAGINEYVTFHSMFFHSKGKKNRS